MGDPAGSAPGRAPVIDCHPRGHPHDRARAVRWTGANTLQVEEVSGHVTRPALAAGTLIVDAWGDPPQLCPLGSWVVVHSPDRIVVVPADELTQRYRVLARRRLDTQEAA